MDAVVSLARIYYPVTALGPGRRVGIWLNGCDRNCEGCISPELQRYDRTKEIPVTEIAGMIRRIRDPIDGITVSGGEPFYRPKALAALVRLLSPICDDILIFTGYTLEELEAGGDASVREVLQTCAALIDGPYVRSLRGCRGLRGSSNQKCHVFKYADRYRSAENGERHLQTILYGNSVLTIGIPDGESVL